MRLLPFEKGLSNILTDLMTGTNMKFLLESVTGQSSEKIQTFDKLTTEQIRTRCDWAVKELKENQIIPDDIQVDTRLFAVRSAKHVFDLLWRLVQHDIWFIWERIDFLLQDDINALLEVPLKWVPSKSSIEENTNQTGDGDISLMAGFGLKTAVTEILNNKTNADEMAIGAFMCYFFMMFFKYRQCDAAITRADELRRCHLYAKRKLQEKPDTYEQEMIEREITASANELNQLRTKFNLRSCLKWREHIDQTKSKVYNIIANKMSVRFDWFDITEEMSIKEICHKKAVNLVLTDGFAFYKVLKQEIVTSERKFILINKQTRQIIVDKSICETNVRAILSVAAVGENAEVKAERYPQYEVYVNAPSANKVLPEKSIFLYQIFPNSIKVYHGFIIKACMVGHLEVIQHLVEFFRILYPNFINMQDSNTGNTALHIACRYNQATVGQYCLDNGADVDSINKDGNTPLFLAAEAMSKQCAKLLLEYGADVTIVNNRKKTIFEACVGDEFRQILTHVCSFITSVVPPLTKGDTEVLEAVIQDHIENKYTLSSLNSRFINGSTLLHTACYFKNLPVVTRLLNMGMNPDVRDYKGQTTLHRTKDPKLLKFLIESNATIDAPDHDGNTPLHIKCLGETGKPSELKTIKILHEYGAELCKRNYKSKMPFHLAAENGQTDALKLLLLLGEKDIRESIASETAESVPSTLTLALRAGHLDTAVYLAENDFQFKNDEPKILMNEILTEKIPTSEPERILKFLCEKGGANLSMMYDGGDTALHLAAAMASTEPLKLLIQAGADVSTVNNSKETPLFIATRTNNMDAAEILIRNGIDYRQKNAQGLTAFDYIMDIDEWLATNRFDEETRARLKGFFMSNSI
ncbi:unnamed protein product [Didymodactylos carnosus]|uniref:Ankyrin repeat protein n=1 Tax=Didymodactylos carnosus TaxID=1234261 RepID=A0A8S2CNX7_9BILA|nr:unnamed protein product [Didymodactylos carnosus]CAF3506355.1 unnamed protein product [Didymodactylos carnosus]